MMYPFVYRRVIRVELPFILEISEFTHSLLTAVLLLRFAVKMFLQMCCSRDTTGDFTVMD